MSEKTKSAQQKRHDEQTTRATELRTRVLEILAGDNDKTNAAASARFLIGAFKLLKAAGETLLIQRKANGEDVRVPMLLEVAATITGQEGIKLTAPIYLENLQPFIDRLLNAAAESLDAETPFTAEGELPDISVLGDYHKRGEDVSSRTVSYLMTNDDLEPKVRADVSLAGWLAADLKDLADQADSIGYKLSGPFDFLEELANAMLGAGREESPADALEEALKGVAPEVLIGATYHRYLDVALPLLADLNTLIDNTVPAAALELAWQIAQAEFPGDDWNKYCLHATDGFGEHEMQIIPWIEKMIRGGFNYFGYCEINPYGSWWGNFETSGMRAVKGTAPDVREHCGWARVSSLDEVPAAMMQIMTKAKSGSD